MSWTTDLMSARMWGGRPSASVTAHDTCVRRYREIARLSGIRQRIAARQTGQLSRRGSQAGLSLDESSRTRYCLRPDPPQSELLVGCGVPAAGHIGNRSQATPPTVFAHGPHTSTLVRELGRCHQRLTIKRSCQLHHRRQFADGLPAQILVGRDDVGGERQEARLGVGAREEQTRTRQRRKVLLLCHLGIDGLHALARAVRREVG